MQGCNPTTNITFFGVLMGELANPGWFESSIIQEWVEPVAVGRKEFTGPMLAMVDEKDIKPVEFLEKAVDLSCEAAPGESF